MKTNELVILISLFIANGLSAQNLEVIPTNGKNVYRLCVLNNDNPD